MDQSRYGNSTGGGRRIVLPAEDMLIAKARGKAPANGVAEVLGDAYAATVRHYGKQAAKGAGLAGAGFAGGYATGRRKVHKAYDSEHRRQRRLGMAEAALAGAGAVGAVRGAKGIRQTTRAARKISGVVGPKDTYDATALTRDTLKAKGSILARRKDAAYLGGGLAGLGGAATVRQHAEGRRGRAWN